jgi:hypothetical protein
VSWFGRKARLVYPVPPAPRTAVLSAAFGSRGTIRAFDDPSGVPAFEPQAVAGTLARIESLAGLVQLTHAVIVFRNELEPRLTEPERDRLWRAFHVPLFEQIIGPDGTLYAWECEAHAGLHIASARFDTARHTIDETPCACGLATARLIFLNAAPVKTRSAAAGGS